MPSFFFDTSALVKHYIEEIGSDWVTGLVTQPGARNYIASVTGVEMTAALARRGLTQSLTRFETDFVNDYRRLALPESTLDLARQLARQHRLRGYDAIQLASAITLAEALGKAQVEFICADAELLVAARKSKLRTGDPNDHP